MNKQLINIVSIYCDGNIVTHPFYKYSDAQDKFVLCIKESQYEISEEHINNAGINGYFYDEFDGAVITLDTREIQ